MAVLTTQQRLVLRDEFMRTTDCPSINFNQNVTPRITTGSSITED